MANQNSNHENELVLTNLNTENSSLQNIDKEFNKSISKVEILTITDSFMPNLRNLGTNLKNLVVLKVPQCGVVELDGLSICQHLKEIYLPFNEICTVCSIMFLTKLEILDLESNNIDDLQEIDYLSILSNLKLLNLLNNPITEKQNYKSLVTTNLPNLKVLDYNNLSQNKSNLNLKENENLLNEQIKTASNVDKIYKEIGDFSPVKLPNPVKRPMTAIPRNYNRNNFYTNFDSLSLNSTNSFLSPGKSPGSISQNSSISYKSPIKTPSNLLKSSVNTGYSDLTTGKVMVGSAARSLRSRRKEDKFNSPNYKRPMTAATFTRNNNFDIESDKKLLDKIDNLDILNLENKKSKFGKTVKDKYDAIEMQLNDAEEETDTLLKELKEWRKQHTSTLDAIKSKSNKINSAVKYKPSPPPMQCSSKFRPTPPMSKLSVNSAIDSRVKISELSL